MNAIVSPMQYLDKAMNSLHQLGLVPQKTSEEAPITALLNQISDLDEERVVAITRTLSQASLFNEVVREQVQAMEIGSRYEEITSAFATPAAIRNYRAVKQSVTIKAGASAEVGE